MATFQDLAGELVGSVPRIDYLKARQLVNRAWREIRDSRPWTFLLAETTLDCPSQIATGTVSVSQFSKLVTADATAKVVLDVVGLNIPLSDRQFRIAGSTQIYNITNYDDVTGIITLDRNFAEPDNSASAYLIFRCYYKAPTDFLRWLSIRDIQNGYSLRLHGLRQELDRKDPMRTATGNPVQIFSYKADANGVPIYEMWPSPSTAQNYNAIYQRRGIDLIDGDSLPVSIPDELVAQRVLYYGAQWALMNAGRFPELRATRWEGIMADTKLQYQQLLEQTKRQDNEMFLQNYILDRDNTGRWPIDSRFMQSHDTGL